MQTATPDTATKSRQPRPAVALPATLHPEQRLRWQQVSALVGLGKTKIYELIAKGEFPPPEKHGYKCARWRAGTVLDWQVPK